jgi:hypothetical protein
MSPKQWVFAPDSGGVKMPEAVKQRTEARLHRYAEQHLAGRYTRLDIRFKGQFCYVERSTFNASYSLPLLTCGSLD